MVLTRAWTPAPSSTPLGLLHQPLAEGVKMAVMIDYAREQSGEIKAVEEVPAVGERPAPPSTYPGSVRDDRETGGIFLLFLRAPAAPPPPGTPCSSTPPHRRRNAIALLARGGWEAGRVDG